MLRLQAARDFEKSRTSTHPRRSNSGKGTGERHGGRMQGSLGCLSLSQSGHGPANRSNILYRWKREASRQEDRISQARRKSRQECWRRASGKGREEDRRDMADSQQLKWTKKSSQ